jgi:hypothetical protein
MKPTRQPTAEECRKCAAFETNEIGTWYAMYSPQFGGYVGRTAVFIYHNVDNTVWHHNVDNTCFEVAVWHDGEFGADYPAHFHCCSADQFIQFGQKVRSLLKGE